MALTTATVGCGPDQAGPLGGPTAATPVRAVRSGDLVGLVTRAAAAAVGPDGRFALAAPAPLPGQATISAARATELATAYTRSFAPQIRPALEQDRGAPIGNFQTLAPCGPIPYAESAFAPTAAGTPDHVRFEYGPWWLVSMCESDGKAAISVAVSAYATMYELRKGVLYMPPGSSGGVIALGVPVEHGALPLTPERAVQLAAGITGQRIAGVPRLVAPAPGHGRDAGWPQQARWRLPLEVSATVKHAVTGQALTVQEVYVGIGRFGDAPAVSAPAQVQPDADSVTTQSSSVQGVKFAEQWSRLSRGLPPRADVVTVQVPRGAHHVHFEPVASAGAH